MIRVRVAERIEVGKRVFTKSKKMREVMVWVVFALGVSVLNGIAIGVPMTSATRDGTSDLGQWSSVKVHKREEGESNRQLNGKASEGTAPVGSTLSKNFTSSGSIGSTNDKIVSNVKVQGTNGSSSNDLVAVVLEGTIRVLNESLASSPADVHMSERGVRGMVKEVSSSIKELGRNLKKMVKLGNEGSFKVLTRNESMIVVGVADIKIGKERSQGENVFIDGNDVVVAVKGRDGDGRNETREMRIKIGGKYDLESEKVYVDRDDGDAEWGTKIIIGLSEKKMKLKLKKECEEKSGESGIDRDLCICEKMKDGKAKRGDVECVSGIVKKLMKISNDNMKVYNGNEMCRQKKGMQNIYECLVKMLQKMDEEGSYLSKSHGRSMLSWSGWMEEGDFEEDDEEEGLEEEEEEEEEEEGGGRGERRKMVMYVMFVVMLVLVIVCLNDLKGQCGRYRQERGRVYEVVRLPEYAQTIYSRMIRR